MSEPEDGLSNVYDAPNTTDTATNTINITDADAYQILT